MFPCIPTLSLVLFRDISMPKGPNLPPPPTHKILCRDIDAKVFQSLRAEMTIIRPLHTSIRIVPFGICLDVINAQPHNLTKDLANLVLGVLVLARELQDLREGGRRLGLEAVYCDILPFVSSRRGGGERGNKPWQTRPTSSVLVGYLSAQ